jgi:DNA-3-methyladenine glycosylase
MAEDAQVKRGTEGNVAQMVQLPKPQSHLTSVAVGGGVLSRKFFEMRPEAVAPRLLGKLLVHRNDAGTLAGRIVEAEAYLGPHNDPPDPAAHTHRGPTPRNVVLFGLAGHAYVYSIYGKYFCLNVSCEAEGLAGCVLLRALEPVTGLEQMAKNRGLPPDLPRTDNYLRQLTSGPSRLCQALGVERMSHNGLDVTDEASPLQIRDDGFVARQAMATPRIGINAANEAVGWPLRFALPGSACVSGPKSLKGQLVAIP